MNILIISASLPYPLSSGGNIRVYNMLKRLSNKHKIFLVAFIRSKEELQYLPAVKEICHDVYPVLLKPGLRDTRLYFALATLFLRTPPGISYLRSLEMHEIINNILSKEAIDLVQIEWTQMAQYRPEGHTIPAILTEHDIFFKSLQRYFEVEKNPVKKLFRYLQWKKKMRYELDVLKQFDKVVAVTDVDKQILLSHEPTLNIEVISSGADIDYYQPDGVFADRKTSSLVFVGGAHHYPNVDGILYFSKEIFPLIKQECPDIKLFIIGPDKSGAYNRIAGDPNITLTGYVDDIRPYLKQAISVVPIRIGSGIRIKILEAMAAGSPVVSTTIGSEGIYIMPGQNILIADQPRDFASAVIRLVQNRKLREELVKKGRKLVETKYSWDQLANRLDELYKELLK